jgi:hypothetical protein
VRGAIQELEHIHAEIAAVRSTAATEQKRLQVVVAEKLSLIHAAKASLVAHGFTGELPEDIQLYCPTTHCHCHCTSCTCWYCYCDRPHNCYYLGDTSNVHAGADDAGHAAVRAASCEETALR